jgi:hypothetical protein
MADKKKEACPDPTPRKLKFSGRHSKTKNETASHLSSQSETAKQTTKKQGKICIVKTTRFQPGESKTREFIWMGVKEIPFQLTIDYHL